MANATQPLNLTDFTGGLNLRASEFQLGENESPDILNCDIDPRGGLASRKGWQRWNAADIDATWDPRSAYIHELASGIDIVLVANNDKVYRSTGGTFTTLETGVATPLVADAAPHGMDFAPWGDTAYFACGYNRQAAKLVANGTYASLLTAAETGTWVNDYLSPVGGRMPRADYMCSHNGYIWVAGTYEDAEHFPHRIRWSHPNNPEDWAEADFEDILEGGGPITGIMPFEDHLLVFKQSSIWAIYGATAESRQIVNVSRTLGALNRQCLARNENTVFFVSWPKGVHSIARGRVDEISVPLRPAFESVDWNEGANDFMWLGWLGNRLWFSGPFLRTGVASDARSTFVLDPEIGAWTLYRSATQYGVGPFAQGGWGQGSTMLLACLRDTPDIVEVEARDDANDVLSDGEVAQPFQSKYVTRWLHAGWPDRKKRWRRPTFIAKLSSVDYRLQCSIYTNFLETAAKRRFDVVVSAGDGVVKYDDGINYDEGAIYGEGVEGSTLRKGGAVGSASAVQLQIDSEPGKAWGIDGIVMKYRQRRFT